MHRLVWPVTVNMQYMLSTPHLDVDFQFLSLKCWNELFSLFATLPCICEIKPFPFFVCLLGLLMLYSVYPQPVIFLSLLRVIWQRKTEGWPHLPVLSSVPDSCGVLDEAGPGAAYLYGLCPLRACRGDKKSFTAKHIVCLVPHLHVTLVHLLFLCCGDVAALGESMPAFPWQEILFLCACVCVCTKASKRAC